MTLDDANSHRLYTPFPEISQPGKSHTSHVSFFFHLSSELYATDLTNSYQYIGGGLTPRYVFITQCSSMEMKE